MNTYVIIFAMFLTLSCSVKAQTTKTLTEAERYKLAAEYSAANRGRSVLVMKGDKIVFEDYENGHTAEMPWFLASGTKSFSGVMLAAAIEDKLVKSFDEKVCETITEWKNDKQKSLITLRQLLSLTSGIEAGQIGLVPEYDAGACAGAVARHPVGRVGEQCAEASAGAARLAIQLLAHQPH